MAMFLLVAVAGVMYFRYKMNIRYIGHQGKIED